MNITKEELEKLQKANNEGEWNFVCDKIKNARNGSYPPDWWARVIMSGLLQQKERQFRAGS